MLVWYSFGLSLIWGGTMAPPLLLAWSSAGMLVWGSFVLPKMNKVPWRRNSCQFGTWLRLSEQEELHRGATIPAHFRFLWATEVPRQGEVPQSSDPCLFGVLLRSPRQKEIPQDQDRCSFGGPEWESSAAYYRTFVKGEMCWHEHVDMPKWELYLLSLSLAAATKLMLWKRWHYILDLEVSSFSDNFNRCWSFLGLIVKPQKSCGHIERWFENSGLLQSDRTLFKTPY